MGAALIEKVTGVETATTTPPYDAETIAVPMSAVVNHEEGIDKYLQSPRPVLLAGAPQAPVYVEPAAVVMPNWTDSPEVATVGRPTASTTV